MPQYTNLSCITDLIDVVNPCTADQSGVDYFLDDLGISLATTAKAADERYSTGQSLVDNKVRIALDDVYMYLTQNVSDDCDLDKATGIMCNNATRIARAMWYRVAALVFKEIAVDSKRYNDIIHYAGSEALAQMIYYDSSLVAFTSLNPDAIPSGQYQKQLDRLATIKSNIELICCSECTGSGWRIVIP